MENEQKTSNSLSENKALPKFSINDNENGSSSDMELPIAPAVSAAIERCLNSDEDENSQSSNKGTVSKQYQSWLLHEFVTKAQLIGDQCKKVSSSSSSSDSSSDSSSEDSSSSSSSSSSGSYSSSNSRNSSKHSKQKKSEKKKTPEPEIVHPIIPSTSTVAAKKMQHIESMERSMQNKKQLESPNKNSYPKGRFSCVEKTTYPTERVLYPSRISKKQNKSSHLHQSAPNREKLDPVWRQIDLNRKFHEPKLSGYKSDGGYSNTVDGHTVCSKKLAARRSGYISDYTLTQSGYKTDCSVGSYKSGYKSDCSFKTNIYDSNLHRKKVRRKRRYMQRSNTNLAASDSRNNVYENELLSLMGLQINNTNETATESQSKEEQKQSSSISGFEINKPKNNPRNSLNTFANSLLFETMKSKPSSSRTDLFGSMSLNGCKKVDNDSNNNSNRNKNNLFGSFFVSSENLNRQLLDKKIEMTNSKKNFGLFSSFDLGTFPKASANKEQIFGVKQQQQQPAQQQQQQQQHSTSSKSTKPNARCSSIRSRRMSTVSRCSSVRSENSNKSFKVKPLVKNTSKISEFLIAQVEQLSESLKKCTINNSKYYDDGYQFKHKKASKKKKNSCSKSDSPLTILSASPSTSSVKKRCKKLTGGKPPEEHKLPLKKRHYLMSNEKLLNSGKSSEHVIDSQKLVSPKKRHLVETENKKNIERSVNLDQNIEKLSLDKGKKTEIVKKKMKRLEGLVSKIAPKINDKVVRKTNDSPTTLKTVDKVEKQLTKSHKSSPHSKALDKELIHIPATGKYVENSQNRLDIQEKTAPTGIFEPTFDIELRIPESIISKTTLTEFTQMPSTKIVENVVDCLLNKTGANNLAPKRKRRKQINRTGFPNPKKKKYVKSTSSASPASFLLDKTPTPEKLGNTVIEVPVKKTWQRGRKRKVVKEEIPLETRPAKITRRSNVQKEPANTDKVDNSLSILNETNLTKPDIMSTKLNTPQIVNEVQLNSIETTVPEVAPIVVPEKVVKRGRGRPTNAETTAKLLAEANRLKTEKKDPPNEETLSKDKVGIEKEPEKLKKSKEPEKTKKFEKTVKKLKSDEKIPPQEAVPEPKTANFIQKRRKTIACEEKEKVESDNEPLITFVKKQKKCVTPLPSLNLQKKTDDDSSISSLSTKGSKSKKKSQKVLSEELEKAGVYQQIKQNVYHSSVKPKLRKPLECDCKPESGCKDNCLNRITFSECSLNLCPSKMNCTNRVIQKQKFVKYVEKFMTEKKGLGIRTRGKIEKDTFIMEYLGEVITEKMFKERMDTIYANDTHHYCLNIDSGLVIDGHRMGSECRFVNHSCNPNCEMQKIYVHGLPRMILVAKREIQPMEELTYDYKFSLYNPLEGQDCYCGEETCRGKIIREDKRIRSTDYGSDSDSNGKRRRKKLQSRISCYMSRNLNKILQQKTTLISTYDRLQNKPMEADDPKIDFYLCLRHKKSEFEKFYKNPKDSKIVTTISCCNVEPPASEPTVSLPKFDGAISNVLQEIAEKMKNFMVNDENVMNQVAIPEPANPGSMHERISYDISIDGILENLSSGIYETQLLLFNYDMKIMIDNIVKFYGINSKQGKLALQLKSYYKELRESVREKLQPVVETKELLNCFYDVFNANTKSKKSQEEEDIIQCICGLHRDEGTMIQCTKCLIWQHIQCTKADSSIEKYFCEKCDPRDVDREITVNETTNEGYQCYLTLMRDNLQVRLGDSVYVLRDIEIEDDGEKDPEKKTEKRKHNYKTIGTVNYSECDIFRVEQMWKDENGVRRVYGHHYLRPYETYHEPTRRFYSNELMRVPLFETINIDLIIDTCWVLDPTTYFKGRPMESIEKHVYVCEFKVDKPARQFTKLKSNQRPSICTKNYAFYKFEERLRQPRNLLPEAEQIVKKMKLSKRKDEQKQEFVKKEIAPEDSTQDKFKLKTEKLEKLLVKLKNELGSKSKQRERHVHEHHRTSTAKAGSSMQRRKNKKTKMHGKDMKLK